MAIQVLNDLAKAMKALDGKNLWQFRRQMVLSFEIAAQGVQFDHRPEALQYREACLKYTVKKSERHLLMDVLREIGAEIEGSLYAGSFIDRWSTD